MDERINRITQFGKLIISQDCNLFYLEWVDYDESAEIDVKDFSLDSAIENLDNQLRLYVNYC